MGGFERKYIVGFGTAVYAPIRALESQSLWSRHFLKTCGAEGEGRRSGELNSSPIAEGNKTSSEIAGATAVVATGWHPRDPSDSSVREDHPWGDLRGYAEPRGP